MDIRSRLSGISFVDVVPDISSLTPDVRAAVRHCIRAADHMTEVALRQASLDNLRWREQLAGREDSEGKALRRYFAMNGGPWDRFNHDEPFLPEVGHRPKGGAFYPSGLTEQEWRAWLASHPDEADRLESNYTVVQRKNSRLVAIPYSDAYHELLEAAAVELTAAAGLLPECATKRFLELRAQAFLSNDYWDSDLVWIETDGRPFEITIGPYEVYTDGLFGLKATFEAFLGLPDEESSRELQGLSAALTDFDGVLSERFDYRPKGSASPVEVVQDLYRAGDAAFGRQFVAYNLPNDRRIHELKGSKKVISRTLMQAKFSRIGEPIAARLLDHTARERYQFRNRLLFVLAHELAHGLGPGGVRVGNREVNFEVLLRDLHSPLEEAKADALGVTFLKHLAERNQLTAEDVVGCIVTLVTDWVQEWRTSYFPVKKSF